MIKRHLAPHMARPVAIVAALGLAAFFIVPAWAATPASGQVGPANGSTATTDFAPVAGVSVGGTPTQGVVCLPPDCDSYDVKVVLPAPDDDFYLGHNATLSLHYSWTSPVMNDMDVHLIDPKGNDAAGPGDPDTSNSGDNFENLEVSNPASGTWQVWSYGGITPVPTAAHAVIKLTYASKPAIAAALPLLDDPGFLGFHVPLGYQTRDFAHRPNAGEPSVGVDLKTGAIMYFAGTQVSRITVDDSKSPAVVKWTDVTPINLRPINEDPVMFVDKYTGRTFAAGDAVACNLAAFSDDDGASWTPSQGCGEPYGFDHPAVIGGRFAKGGTPSGSYPDAVYQCSQEEVEAFCQLSTNGGLTFGVSTPVWNGACTAIHGHPRIGPDGWVYLPNAACGAGQQGLGVSSDNNQSWTVHVIPDSKSSGAGDPSVDVGPDNTVYFGYADGSGHPKIAVSHDHGVHWAQSVDVGAERNFKGTESSFAGGIVNTEFPEVIAGGPGRAAFAFLGTATPGNTQAPDFAGTWYLFVSYTYDGGKHWRTVNATPNNPVQRGCIWNGGGGNVCRNLLDFNDITVDTHGRVIVGYTDGCTTDSAYSCDKTKRIDSSGCTNVQGEGESELSNETSSSSCTYGRQSAIVRQSCGRPLLAAYDHAMKACAASASVKGVKVVKSPKKTVKSPHPLPATGVGTSYTLALALLAGAALAGRSLKLRRR